MPLFEASGMSVAFGGVRALDGLSLTVDEGEIAGLIGPNGAGKTTFVDAVSGFVRCSGSVRLGEVALDRLPPHRRARAGLARTWQNAELFDDLSVLDNIRLVDDRLTPGALVRGLFRSRQVPASTRVHETLERLDIVDLAGASPRELPAGQRKLVGLARALASDARLILMDEPAAGLDRDETAALRVQLIEVAAGGVAILLIEHDMDLVLSTCRTLHVLNMGRHVTSGPVDTVRSDPEVVNAYLGTDEDADDDMDGDADVEPAVTERAMPAAPAASPASAVQMEGIA